MLKHDTVILLYVCAFGAKLIDYYLSKAFFHPQDRHVPIGRCGHSLLKNALVSSSSVYVPEKCLAASV